MPGTSPILVTGAAGFVGMHVAARLLDLGHDVLGFDFKSALTPPKSAFPGFFPRRPAVRDPV